MFKNNNNLRIIGIILVTFAIIFVLAFWGIWDSKR